MHSNKFLHKLLCNLWLMTQSLPSFKSFQSSQHPNPSLNTPYMYFFLKRTWICAATLLTPWRRRRRTGASEFIICLQGCLHIRYDYVVPCLSTVASPSPLPSRSAVRLWQLTLFCTQAHLHMCTVQYSRWWWATSWFTIHQYIVLHRLPTVPGYTYRINWVGHAWVWAQYLCP